MKKLRQHAISGVKWSAVSQSGVLITQLLGILILARLLPASDFGLLAMAMVAIGFATLFQDLGTASAIIQKISPKPELLDSVFWLNLGFGGLLALILFMASPLIAAVFIEPALQPVLITLSAIFPVTALGIVHRALLEKASRFRPIAIIECSAAFLSLGGAVCAALSGWGVYSLVLQTWLFAFLTMSGFWLVSSWRPRFHLDWKEIQGLVGFSGNLLGFNIFNYFVRNADNLLIGRFLGSADLGYYSMAYRLMLWPIQNISRVIGRVMFPVFSSIQHDNQRMTNAYLKATTAIALLTAPLMFGFFILREPIVLHLLGEQWQPIMNVLAWLIPVGFIQSISTTVGSIYLAKGRTGLMFKWGILAGLITVPAFVIGLQWGIEGVAASYAITMLIRFYPGFAIPLRLLGLRVGSLIRQLLPSIVNASLMAVMIALFMFFWPAVSMTGFIILVISGVAIYSSLSFFTQREIVTDIWRGLLNNKS